jgi:hypothetical protein
MSESKWIPLTIFLGIIVCTDVVGIGVDVCTDVVGILRQTYNTVELFVWAIQLCFTRVVKCDFEIKRTGNAGSVLLLILAREYLHFNFRRDCNLEHMFPSFQGRGFYCACVKTLVLYILRNALQ